MSSPQTSAYEIGRRTGVCAHSGRELTPGDPFVAALVEREGEEGFDRLDYSVEAWAGGARPARLFGFWRAVVPEPDARPKVWRDDEELLALLESLEDAEDEKRVAFRFVLALILMRKRALKPAGTRRTKDGALMLVRRKGDDQDAPPMAIVDPGLDEGDVDALVEQIQTVMRGDA